ncbi:17844_t:CDS:2 [Acaulospora morrowiae]|uniref:17844_t:CDS:1 n=1 Tax=Acaulospora morrowiae TaxID=94023 RepID=A0A9N9GYD9_9GLOM|nr:17844_t:CDS:2 [Acaulospora morrowiae]
MSSVSDEIYVGHVELVSYLATYTSFWGFISRFREVIVTSSLTSPTSCRQDLDNTWVRLERLRGKKGLEEYWKGVEQECKMKRDITNHKAEIERVHRNISELNEQLRIKESDLSVLNEQLQIKEVDLSELTSKWYKSNINSNHSDMGDFVEGFEDDLDGNSNGRSVDDDNNSSSDFGSNCNDVGNFAEGFGDDLGGNSDRGSVDENTPNTPSGVVGTQNSRRKINRKRRDAPPLSREFNLRARRNVNYNVGPSSKRRHKNKPTPSSSSPQPPSSSSSPQPPSSPQLPPPQSPISLLLSSPQISLPPSPIPPHRDRICNRKCSLHCFTATTL